MHGYVRFRHYLSPGFLAARLRERGLAWSIMTGMQRLIPFVLWCLLSYPMRWLGVRFIPVHVRRIGHLAPEVDCHIKLRELDGRRGRFELVYAPRSIVCNMALVDYWRQYLTFVTSPFWCWLLTPFAGDPKLQIDISSYVLSVGEAQLYHLVQKRWAEKPPLLTLRSEAKERGRECLRKMGLPDDAWFVCFHAREPGYVAEDFQSYRDSPIEGYLSAVRAITERGGWCIRMGDPTMQPLPEIDRVIDYAHHPLRSDWMDVFLCASCRFFLGNSSGIAYVSTLFNVPVAVAQMAPMSAAPFSFRDLGNFKLVWSDREQRDLSFEEVLGSDIGSYRDTREFSRAGLRCVDNTGEEIRELALEMLDRVNGSASYTLEDEESQETFRSLIRPVHMSYMRTCRVGRDFLSRHRSLLPGGAGTAERKAEEAAGVA